MIICITFSVLFKIRTVKIILSLISKLEGNFLSDLILDRMPSLITDQELNIKSLVFETFF